MSIENESRYRNVDVDGPDERRLKKKKGERFVDILYRIEARDIIIRVQSFKLNWESLQKFRGCHDHVDGPKV